MSENRKTFRLTNEVQKVVDNYREESQTGPSWNRKKVNENEAVNLIIDEFPRIKYLEKQLSELREKHENLEDKQARQLEAMQMVSELFFPDLMDAFREQKILIQKGQTEIKHLAEKVSELEAKTAIPAAPAPDQAAAPAPIDSKSGKAEGTRAKKQTATKNI